MIAPVNSEIWDNISDPHIFSDGTGSPYPPFAFGSGMGTQPVPASELPKLGLAPKRQTPRKLSFNAKIQFSATDLDDDIKQSLLDAMTGWVEARK